MAIDERPPATPHRPSLEGRKAAPQPSRFPTPAARVRRWQRLFAGLLSITDVLVIAFAVFTAQFLRFGFGEQRLVIPGVRDEYLAVAYSIVSIVMITGWALSMRLFGTRDYKIIGTGVVEYKRVTNATLSFFGLFAIIAFALHGKAMDTVLVLATNPLVRWQDTVRDKL